MTTFFGVINLARSWQTAWTVVAGSSNKLPFVLVLVAAAVVLFGVVEYIRESRRGGGNRSKLIYTLIVAAFIAIPRVVVPAILTAADFVVNTGLGLFSHTVGRAPRG